MGYVKHHAIIVVGHDKKDLEVARKQARKMFKNLCSVTKVTKERTNGCCSFMVSPDGSKEGWDTSHQGDEARKRFKNWLNGCYDKNLYLDWVEVAFGGDFHNAVVEDHGDLHE